MTVVGPEVSNFKSVRDSVDRSSLKLRLLRTRYLGDSSQCRNPARVLHVLLTSSMPQEDPCVTRNAMVPILCASAAPLKPSGCDTACWVNRQERDQRWTAEPAGWTNENADESASGKSTNPRSALSAAPRLTACIGPSAHRGRRCPLPEQRASALPDP
jgi:hypothetical protein